MRLLFLTDFYPPHIGGLERHVQTLAREFAKRGHCVSVATMRHPGLPAMEETEGVKVFRLAGLVQRFRHFYADSHRQFHPTAPDPMITWGLRNLIEAEHPQVV